MLGVGLGQIANVLAKFDSRNLHVDPNQCARLRHMRGTCARCMDNCPQHAISFDDTLHVDVDKCNDCGICAGVCPTGALEATSPSNADLIHLIEQRASMESLVFACPRVYKGSHERVIGISCIGRLDESILVGAVAHGIRQVHLVDGACQDCPSTGGRKAASRAVAETNKLAAAFGMTPRVSLVPTVPFSIPEPDTAPRPSQELSRRAFFTSLLRETKTATALTVSTVLEKEPAKPTGRVKGALVQRASAKRELLMQMLPRLGQVVNPNFEMENGSWATCQIKKSCTACQMCAFFCPTGALSKTVQDGKPALAFRVAHCTNCGLCAEVCYWKSLELDTRVDLTRVLADASEVFTFDEEALTLLSPQEKSNRLLKSLFGI